MYTTADVIAKLKTVAVGRVAAPPYMGSTAGSRICLAVESVRRHVTDEAWQLQAGLQANGYTLYGYGLEHSETDVDRILHDAKPAVVVVQDRREWEVPVGGWRESKAYFEHPASLYNCGAFVVTMVKDLHWCPTAYVRNAEAMGVHAWIVYYHRSIAAYLAPYMRPEHVIRTYHTVDADAVPEFNADGRRGALLSGAILSCYPLRMRIRDNIDGLPEVDVLKHPGYRLRGCKTAEYMREMSKYKVAICTASIYGYAVRKIVEATAAGCMVLTDLPDDEVLPEIDGNLVRVRPDASLQELKAVLQRLYESYDADRQARFAEQAKSWYDYRVQCKRLSEHIERMRANDYYKT